MKLSRGKYVRTDLTHRSVGICFNGKVRDEEDFPRKLFRAKICLTDIFIEMN